MVILMVLATLLILVVFTLQLGDSSTVLHKLEDRTRQREQNYQVARSAVELAMDLLKVDDVDVDSARDPWALGSQRLRWEGRDLVLEIRDEESRFPISQLPLPGKEEPDRQLYAQALERLLTRTGLPGAPAVASLEDWLDADDDVRTNGAEQGSYPQLTVKNGPLDSIDELERLKNWGPPQLPPPPPLDPSSPNLDEFRTMFQGGSSKNNQANWGDFLSAYATGRVNANTAPKEVLASLDEAMSDSIVTELMAYRSRNVLHNQEDLKKIPGIDNDLAFRLNKLMGYSSQVFRVRVIVTSREVPLELEAMLERKSQKEVAVRYWRAR
ncbi:general secretion pathway protein GspK [bacterium]|nr:general secretion pathway protein GspK [bacterium]